MSWNKYKIQKIGDPDERRNTNVKYLKLYHSRTELLDTSREPPHFADFDVDEDMSQNQSVDPENSLSDGDTEDIESIAAGVNGTYHGGVT